MKAVVFGGTLLAIGGWLTIVIALIILGGPE